MRQYLGALGRDVAIINLDPANDNPPYEAAVDLADLVSLEVVMEEKGLGPNGEPVTTAKLSWHPFVQHQLAF
jgi:hypothetical protein